LEAYDALTIGQATWTVFPAERWGKNAVAYAVDVAKITQSLMPMSDLAIQSKRLWILPTIFTTMIFGVAYLNFEEAGLLDISNHIQPLIVIVLASVVSGVFNAIFDSKYKGDDPFLWIELSPENLMERTMCIFGGTLGILFLPILDMLIILPLFKSLGFG